MSASATARLAYSPAEAAEVLGVCRATIYNRMQDGTIPSVRIGAARRIPAAALEALLAEAA